VSSKNESANEVKEGVGLDELKQREGEQMETHPPLMMILCRRAKAQTVSLVPRLDHRTKESTYDHVS
jgi:hypothetical protein